METLLEHCCCPDRLLPSPAAPAPWREHSRWGRGLKKIMIPPRSYPLRFPVHSDPPSHTQREPHTEFDKMIQDTGSLVVSQVPWWGY